MDNEEKKNALVDSYKRFVGSTVGKEFIEKKGHRLRVVACPNNYLNTSQPITVDNDEEVDVIINEFIKEAGIQQNEYFVEKWGYTTEKKYLFLEALTIDIHNID